MKLKIQMLLALLFEMPCAHICYKMRVYLFVQQGFEHTLNDPKKLYTDKVNALLSAWEHVSAVIYNTSPEIKDSMIQWILRHTLRLVLHVEWPRSSTATKTHLNVTLQRCAALLTGENLLKIQLLLNLVNDPWGNPVLNRVLGGSESIGNQEAIELCKTERLIVLTMRLELLTEDKRCCDIALNLARFIIRCLSIGDICLQEDGTEEDIMFINYIYLVLLAKFNRGDEITGFVRQLEVRQGLMLVRSTDRAKAGLCNRLKKLCDYVTSYISHYFLCSAMEKPFEEISSILRELMREFIVRVKLEMSTICTEVKGMIKHATAPHIYLLCEVLEEQFGTAMRRFCVELYIKGLYADINQMEELKVKSEEHKSQIEDLECKSEDQKLCEVQARLSNAYIKLGILLKHCVGVYRECLLTAFSLNPTSEIFDHLKYYAFISNKCLPHNIKSMQAEEQSQCSGHMPSVSLEKPCGSIAAMDCTDIYQYNKSNSNHKLSRTKLTGSVEPIETSIVLDSEPSLNECVHGGENVNLECKNCVTCSSSGKIKYSENMSLSERHKSYCYNSTPCKNNIVSISNENNVIIPSTSESEIKIEPDSVNLSIPYPSRKFILGDTGNLCAKCGKFVERCVPVLHKNDGENKCSLSALFSLSRPELTDSSNYNPFVSPNEILDATDLELSKDLRDDLVSVINNPRNKLLSWSLDWPELSETCGKYLKNKESRNEVKELKYLKIDYEKYKDWQNVEDIDEYYGIEKGYEQWVDISEDEQTKASKSKRKRSRTDASLAEVYINQDGADSCMKQNVRKKCRNRKVDKLDKKSDHMKHINELGNLMSEICDDDTSISDSATQDSKDESLVGSDERRTNFPKKCKGKKDSKVLKNSSPNQLKDISHFHSVVNDDLNQGGVLPVLGNVDENGKIINNGICLEPDFDHTSPENSNQSLSPDKKNSDPSVLKSLRKFRPHNAKKNVRDTLHDTFSKFLKSTNITFQDNSPAGNKSPQQKFAPMLSTLNLNPRIVLEDINSSKIVPTANEDNPSCRQNYSDYIEKNSDNKINSESNKYSESDGYCNSLDDKMKRSDFTEKLLNNEMLAKAVPGLNTLDMIIPLPSEPTVQVVHFPRNPSTANSSNQANQLARNTPKIENSSNSSGSNCLESASTSSCPVSTQQAQSRIITEETQTLQSLPSSIPQSLPQTQEKPKNSQLEVKYLTKASDVNEILRSTLVDCSSQVQAVALVTPSSNTVQKLKTQTEIKYLTNSNEVNEILRSTLTDLNSGQVQSSSQASQLEGHSRIKPSTRSESKVVQSTEVMRNSTVNKKNSEVTETNAKVATVTPQSHKYPTVKALDMSVITNLIAAANSSLIGSVDSQPLGDNILQLIYKKEIPKCNKPNYCTQNVRAGTPSNDKQRLTHNPEKVSSQIESLSSEHGSSQHSIFENFPAASVVIKNNTPAINEQNNASQGASLPKFQQAFGKSIYNQATSNSSSNAENGSTSQSNTNITENSATGHNAAPSNSKESNPSVSSPNSSVHSKAVQTTTVNTLSSLSNSTSTALQTETLSVLIASPVQNSVQISQGQASGTASNCKRSAQTLRSALFDVQQPAATEPGSANLVTTVVTASKNLISSVKSTSSNTDSAKPSESGVTGATAGIPKEGVIKNNRNILLAAALQAASVNHSSSLSTSSSMARAPDVCIVESSSSEDEETDAATQTLISSVQPVQKIAIHGLKKTTPKQIIQTSHSVRPVLHIPGTQSSAPSATNTISTPLRQQQIVQSLLIPVSASSATISRMPSQTVTTSDGLIPHATIEPSVSSTTLEQLREFESVLEQVTNTSQMKERSTSIPQTQQNIINEDLLSQNPPSTEHTPEFTQNQSNASFSQETYPITSITSSPRVGITFVSQSSIRTTNIVAASAGKITSPVVVVTSYCQPVASPALSVTSQSSSSPCVTPAPTPSTSTGKTPPKSSKSKSKSIKSSPATTNSKASPVPKPQQKPQEDEVTAQRIYAILDEYAEQLRNSPDLNNKPAPRRRSNPPTNPNQSSKRKKSAQTKAKLLGQQLSSNAPEMSPGADDPRTMGSEDSSSGIMQLPQIQDSPASSVQTIDEPVSVRSTIDVSSETGGRNSVTEPAENQETHQRRLIFTDAAGMQGRAVLVQDNVQKQIDVTVSGNGTVVAGKSVMVGNAAVPLYVPSGVRQVFLPVASGLTTSVQGRPVVVSKGSKVIRVHQVTGSIQVAAGGSTVQGAAALLVRQMCLKQQGTVGTPVSVLGQPATVKQVKLPLGSISSQTLTGVSAQPPVVLPPGSHHLSGSVDGTATATHPITFPDSSIDGEGVLVTDKKVKQENCVLDSDDNAVSITTASSVNLIHRGVQSSFHGQIISSSGENTSLPISSNAVTTSVTSSPTAGSTSTVVSSVSPEKLVYRNSAHFSTTSLKIENSNVSKSFIENHKDETVSSNCQILSLAQPAVAIVTNSHPESKNSQSPIKNFQCVSLNLPRQTSVRCNTNFVGIQSSDFVSANKPERTNTSSLESSESGCTENNMNSNKSTNLVTQNSKSKNISGSNESRKCGSGFSRHLTQQPDSTSNLRTCEKEREDSLQMNDGFQSSTQNTICASSINMFSQERTVTVIGQTPIKEEKVIPYEGNLQSLGETISNMNEKTNSEDVNRHGEGSNSSDNDINIHKKLQNIGSDNIKCENSIINQEKLPCSSRQLQLDYNNTEFSSKVSNQIDFVNDVAYTISKSENCDTPWRFVPFIRKVKLSLQSIGLKKDSDRPDELSHSLNIGGNRSEVDDGTHDRHAFLTDPKLDSVAKKPSTVPSAVLTTYHKLDVQSQHNDRTHTNDRIQQKIARVERELKLQKSLSEECEDLGVDEPSTSDLFPEADLLLDTNSSPSFDQALQDASCSHCVEPTENYENSSFKPIEYSSSSQEGSNQECSVAVTHTTDSVHKRSKKSHFDWKYGPQSERKRPRRNVAPKVQRIQESGSVTNLQCNNKCIRSDIASNSLEDSSNSYKDNSDVTSNNRLSKSIDNAKSLLSEDKVFLPELRNSGVKDYSSDKNLGKTGNKDSLEESLDTNLKNLSTNVNLKSKSVLGLNNKIIIATSPDDSTFCSSSEDSVTMLDSFSNNMIVSSLDVTIPSPLPALPSTVIQSNDLQETLPSLTSSHKYTNKYGKRTSTCRQDVRFSKRARPNKQNQYFHNDHVESQETWESSSSQDKVCADDEDSGSQSRTEDQPNSDVDIIEISNDAFSSSTSRFSPSPPPKLTIHNSQCQESALKSFNLNGIDLKVSVSNKNDTNKLSHKRLITKRHVDQSELECSAVENLMISKGMDTEHFNHLSKFNSVIHLNSSKTRASLRGHIKKGCTCCSISSQPKKKKELIKIEKPARKTSPVKQIVKGIFSKKR